VTKSLDISALAAGKPSVKVRFHYYNAIYDQWWAIDNVTLLCRAQEVRNAVPVEIQPEDRAPWGAVPEGTLRAIAVREDAEIVRADRRTCRDPIVERNVLCNHARGILNGIGRWRRAVRLVGCSERDWAARTGRWAWPTSSTIFSIKRSSS
jgi:hypothetical protein